MKRRIIIGIDTGGTFTDVACYDKNSGEIKVLKVPSTPHDPALALGDGIKSSGYDKEDIQQINYGTTVGSNALVERRETDINAIAYLTTKGFEDIPFIQRIDRKSHYDLTWNKPEPLVKRKNIFGVSERISYKGEVLEEIDIEELKRIAKKIREGGFKSVAICFLFSYINPRHELIAKQLLEKECPDILLSVSSEIYPKWKEYERSTTTLSDAFLRPIISRHAKNIKGILKKHGLNADFAFMKTNGGLMSLDSAGDNAVHTLNSGPAAGVVAAQGLASQIGLGEDVLTFDIGGTTCDISAIINNNMQYTTSFEIEYGMPIQIPMVDVKAIGAGGGSIAWIDKGGGLQVGPQSMGADPGPICYRRGNTTCVTVTDACLCLGYLNTQKVYGGKLRLREDITKEAVKKFGEKLGMNLLETASAIIKIVNNNMTRAIEVFMARRGLDIRDFILCGFGGSGPMHISAILKESGARDAIVPPNPGVFSALGLLQSDPTVDFQRAIHMNSTNFSSSKIREVFTDLESYCLDELKREGYGNQGAMFLFPSLEMRYFGQNYELEVPISLEDLSASSMADTNLLNKFHDRHETEFGYRIEGEIIEILSARLTIRKEIEKVKFEEIRNSSAKFAPIGEREAVFDSEKALTKVYDRDSLAVGTKLVGPAMIEEETSTTIVDPGITAEVGKFGELVLRRI